MGSLEKYVRMARKMGAENVKVVSTQDLVFDSRTILKCMYGCEDWGRSWSCPSAPGALMPWEAERVLKKYSRGLLVHAHDGKRLQEITYQVEMAAFYDGYRFAFSLSSCYLCEVCAFPEPCRFPAKARLPMEALGIDVFATVKRQGFPIKVLKNKDEATDYYGLVLIE